MEKFDKNIRNDQIKQAQLKGLRWRVIVIWECELKKDFQGEMVRLEQKLRQIIMEL